jgi:preprotein translocase subunit YajC
MNILSLRQIISHAAVAVSVALLPANLAFAEAAGGSDGFASLIPLLLIMVIFWVLLIRPQQKRMKAHGAMIKELKKGDKVVTGGGILGRIVVAKDGILTIEIADGVNIRVKQETVTDLQDNNKEETKS